MKRCFNAVVAASLTASLAVPVPQAFADDAQPDASAQQSAQAVETGGDAAAPSAEAQTQAAADQVSPLLVTEVVTDSPGN